MRFNITNAIQITGRGLMLTGQVEKGQIDLDQTVDVIMEDATTHQATVRDIDHFVGMTRSAEEGEKVGLFIACEGVDLRAARTLIA